MIEHVIEDTMFSLAVLETETTVSISYQGGVNTSSRLHGLEKSKKTKRGTGRCCDL